MIKLGYAVLGAVLICGCGSPQHNDDPIPPPSVSRGNLAKKYSQWDNDQLQLKCAQLRRELDRPHAEYGPPGIVMINQMSRDDKQEEAEELEAEMMRRDPTGNLLRGSQKLQWNKI